MSLWKRREWPFWTSEIRNFPGEHASNTPWRRLSLLPFSKPVFTTSQSDLVEMDSSKFWDDSWLHINARKWRHNNIGAKFYVKSRLHETKSNLDYFISVRVLFLHENGMKNCSNWSEVIPPAGPNRLSSDREEFQTGLKAMLHGAIFLATCNAILLLRDVN
jgi:hypothetical protein